MKTQLPNRRLPVTAFCLSLSILLYAGCAEDQPPSADTAESAPASSPAAEQSLEDVLFEPGAREAEEMPPADATGFAAGQRGAGAGLVSAGDAKPGSEDEFSSSSEPPAGSSPGPPTEADDGASDSGRSARQQSAQHRENEFGDAVGEAREAVDQPAAAASEPSTAPRGGRARRSEDTSPAELGVGVGVGGGGLGMLADGEASADADAVKKESAEETGKARQIVEIELQPGEELWVIARPADVASPPSTRPELPGCGALLAEVDGHPKHVPVPLQHTAVAGKIEGYIATVNMTQQFHNPFDAKIEAVYVFPLPQDAAVSEFVMTIGERKIRGIIRERQQAEQIYRQAKAAGHRAALMTQERPNIFTQKVANIEPGHQIDIELTYFHTLRYDDGEYEFVFPMVVGPRFNPSGMAEGVGAVARGDYASSGQSTEVQYLSPEERSGHDVSLSLTIDAGVAIEDVHSVNHVVNRRAIHESRQEIVLAAADTIPNRDFVLRYRVAGDHVKSALMTHHDRDGGYFTMMLYPPCEMESLRRSPMEMVFVLDCSGSMKGQPLAQSKAAVAQALQSLTPRDTFQIIRFSSAASQLGPEPVRATPENIQAGLDYLAGLSGSGGTQMIEGIRTALQFPHDEGRFRLVAFLTDGFIGNEQQILQTMSQQLGPARVFSFGVGQSPNRYLMDRMAGMGRGAVAYLSLNQDARDVMDDFTRRISHPAMTDLAIDWGDMQVTDVYPARLPDLIVGRPVVVTGRYTGEPGVVSVAGRVGMEPSSFQVLTEEPGSGNDHPGIARVWARLRIKDLMSQMIRRPQDAASLQADVTRTALDHSLMSAYTAFVAVDSLGRTAGDHGTTIAVPVPVPEGVRYETTVGTTGSR